METHYYGKSLELPLSHFKNIFKSGFRSFSPFPPLFDLLMQYMMGFAVLPNYFWIVCTGYIHIPLVLPEANRSLSEFFWNADITGITVISASSPDLTLRFPSSLVILVTAGGLQTQGPMQLIKIS